MDFSDFQIRKCPATAMYIPNFITSDEELMILDKIENAPKPKWTQLLNRRLLNYGGIPHPNGMLAEEIPHWLQMYVDKINNLNIFETQKANHVLVNEYLPGQGIMPHTDGPLFYPTISTISLGSHTILEFTERTPTSLIDETQTPPMNSSSAGELPGEPAKSDNVCFKVLVEPRSLLILKDELYSNYMHGIREVASDILCDRICNYENCENTYKMGETLERNKRISLTIRNVPKTTKMKLKFF